MESYFLKEPCECGGQIVILTCMETFPGKRAMRVIEKGICQGCLKEIILPLTLEEVGRENYRIEEE